MSFKSAASHENIRSQHHCIAENRFKGKIAIVTASSAGIGLAIAKRLAQEGARVIISSRREAKVDEAVSTLKGEGLSVTGLVCHVSNSEHRKKLFEKAEELGGLDILVSNAAVNPVQVPLVEFKEETWNKVLNVNLTASFLLAKEAYPLLNKRGGGTIIFISSIAGYRSFAVNLGCYSITKTALLSLTNNLANELGQDNIRVNCVAPGVIETRFAKYITDHEKYKKLMNIVPLERFGTPEDISGIVAFLASDDAQYITGETIVAAGGVHARL